MECTSAAALPSVRLHLLHLGRAEDVPAAHLAAGRRALATTTLLLAVAAAVTAVVVAQG